jgi:steroid delta-isomerase-like uncharacterized protein
MSSLTDLVHNHYDSIDSNDLDRAMRGFAEDVVTETPNGTLEGVAAFRQMGETFLEAAPDQRMTIRHIYETGDTIVVEGDYAGTHTGPLHSPQGTIPATGRAFTFPFVDVFTVENGIVARHAIYWDNVAFLSQLGMIGAPVSA